MNDDWNASDQNVILKLFSTSELKKSQTDRIIRHNSKGIISREALQEYDGK